MSRLDRLCSLLDSVTPPTLTPGERERIERGRYEEIESLTLSMEHEDGAAAVAGR